MKKVTAVYVGIVDRAGSGFGVSFPDFPGCISGGDDLTEVASNAREALQFHIDGMLEDGEPIPEPMAIAESDDAATILQVRVEVPARQ